MLKKYIFLFLVTAILFNIMSTDDLSDMIISPDNPVFRSGTGIEVLSGTFRGNETRNYYGDRAPSELDVIWKLYLGTGETVISRKAGSRTWGGAGWTGQPLVVREGPDTFLIQGSFDHSLRKINVRDGSVQWTYMFDDVIKGTGTIFINEPARSPEESVVILQGSRLGVKNFLDSKHIPSYRAVSYFTGRELWRMDVRWAGSYSRDVDGSALILDDTAYIALENGVFTVFDPDPANALLRDSMLQPCIFQEEKLYDKEDVKDHKNNVVTESSPALLGNRIYVASGSGHVYGFNLCTKKIDWDFPTGSDMDGSVVVTSDKCLIVTVEKQYIRGRGGVFKLDPSREPGESVKWYLEVKDTTFAGWQGGVIGTAAINDKYVGDDDVHLAAVAALDGNLYIVDHQRIDPRKKSLGPERRKRYNSPLVVAKFRLGPSISSPVVTENKIVFAGYDGIHLISYTRDNLFEKLAFYPATFEASPVVMNERVYIASRDGFLYCFGHGKHR